MTDVTAETPVVENDAANTAPAATGFDAAARGETLTFLEAWCALLAYALQIYFDFSGYSDMAIGLGMMMGFRFAENFNQPLMSQSMTEFWRRWHLTLADFLRDYVFMPLVRTRRLGMGAALLAFARTGQAFLIRFAHKKS